MSELHHPPFVSAALDRVDEMQGPGELREALAVADRRDPKHVPDAALVRLLRRCSVDPDPVMEVIVVRVLMDRTFSWARWKFSGLDRGDRDDIAQGVALALVKAIRRTTGIDFWEITFEKMRERAAADVYQDQHKRFEAENEPEPDDLAEVGSDDGASAVEMSEQAYLLAMGHRTLTADEFDVFEKLVRLDLPIASAKASDDIVRQTGRPEGTVREIMTRIRTKMAGALRKETQ